MHEVEPALIVLFDAISLILLILSYTLYLLILRRSVLIMGFGLLRWTKAGGSVQQVRLPNSNSLGSYMNLFHWSTGLHSVMVLN